MESVIAKSPERKRWKSNWLYPAVVIFLFIVCLLVVAPW